MGRSNKLGRWGEELVARLLGYRRVPFSGGVWPHVQDLLRTRAGGRQLAQVKTTESAEAYRQWIQLERHAVAELAEPRWYEVIKSEREALIFERRLVKRVQLGIGGEA